MYYYYTIAKLAYKIDLRVRSKSAVSPIVYEIKGLGLPASEQTFRWKSNQNRVVTVRDFFQEQHQITLA